MSEKAPMLPSFEVTTVHIRHQLNHIELRTAEDGAIVLAYLSD